MTIIAAFFNAILSMFGCLSDEPLTEEQKKDLDEGGEEYPG